MISRKAQETLAFNALRLSTLVVALTLIAIFYYIISNGIGAVSLSFILEGPKEGMTAGGIFPAVIGTIYLMTLTILFALPLGIGSAIYLSEYARGRAPRILRIIRTATNILAGVPSIVFGLLGLGLFVLFLNFRFSLLSSALALSLLTLPVIIAASEEALEAIPMSFREASLALGATKWQTIRYAVLPYGTPGIMTACILALSRAAGETAPILLTGVAYYLPSLPTSIFSQFMALPFHIFALSTQSYNPNVTRPIQFGTVLVLTMLVLAMNLFAIVVRSYFRRAKKW